MLVFVLVKKLIACPFFLSYMLSKASIRHRLVCLLLAATKFEKDMTKKLK